MGCSIDIYPYVIFPHHPIIAKFGKVNGEPSKGVRLRAVALCLFKHLRETVEVFWHLPGTVQKN